MCLRAKIIFLVFLKSVCKTVILFLKICGRTLTSFYGGLKQAPNVIVLMRIGRNRMFPLVFLYNNHFTYCWQERCPCFDFQKKDGVMRYLNMLVVAKFQNVLQGIACGRGCFAVVASRRIHNHIFVVGCCVDYSWVYCRIQEMLETETGFILFGLSFCFQSPLLDCPLHA